MPGEPPTLQLEDERYRLGDLLGKGGTASVYRATDTALGVTRAIKVLSTEDQRRSSARRRLKAEAQVMAALDHPNILRVYDIGQTREADYIVMELAEGGSLQDWVDARGPMPPRVAAGYLLQVLSALGAAHSAGVVHRDIKPQNILLRADGSAALADFGIALLTQDDGRKTRTGIAMGSLAFMAPEQRLDARSVGATADLYAGASTFFHLMTRANPFDLFSAGEDSARWADVPPPIRRVLRIATRYSPADRYQDARSMARELVAAIQALPPAPEARAPNTIPLEQRILLDTFSSTEERWWSQGDVSWNDATAAAIHLLMEAPQLSSSAQPRPPPEPPATLEEELLFTHERSPTWRYVAAAAVLALLVAIGVQAGSWLSGLRVGAPQPTDAVSLLPGAWEGTLGGFPVSIRLSGTPEDLRGSVTVRVQSSAVSSEVTGRYDESERTLELRDTRSENGGGTYTANLSESGDSLRGHWTSEADNRMLTFEVSRGP